MKERQGLLLGLLMVLLTSAGLAWSAEGIGPWVQVSLGLHGMAMDDVNQSDFRWHSDSPDGFDLDDLSSGMALSLGLGYDLSPAFGYGLSWEHQYAATSGLDREMEADVNLAADIFAGRVNYNFVHSRKWRLGVAGSLGFLAASGDVKMITSGAHFGQKDLSGNCWSLEGLLSLEIMAGETSVIQVTGGWRQAKMDSFKYGGADAKLPDGSAMSLDYTGFTARVGLKYRFGSVENQVQPEIY